ncbi:YbfB/YjiJ family MFS transporter [Paludibacterium purpuratum]|uniref:Putative MFS family arabinose efflux permease n=1 Tax=Paludibacterium purpuratum TaxID=1144873 RepID=A0A4R7B732_9NEIS|nr:YbfB/YjiJ family MFS transporter [Paludibacterium purpuratum]TDR80554.1 putative MFS family arabinose efflux permease [Paludibacterium purpuratum]
MQHNARMYMARHHWLVAWAGMLAMAVAMGFGRFAYTPLYPLMLKDGVITLQQGSWLAAMNYAGYLTGSLAAARWPRERAGRYAALCLLATAICLLLMALTRWYPAILALRLLAGFLSAGAMVTVSTRCLRADYPPAMAPMLYAGVGLGIVLSTWLIDSAVAHAIQVGAIWEYCAVAALLLSLLPLALLPRPHPTPAPQAAPSHLDLAGLSRRHLALVYTLAGFGYIISATYLPLMLSQSSRLQSGVALVWGMVGVAAMLSCHLWHWILTRVNVRRALLFNLCIQAVGVGLPAIVPQLWANLCAAACLGGTFMGTVVIVMPAARQLQAGMRANLLGIMTFGYGLGQVAGPFFAQLTIARFGTLAAALGTSAAILFLAAGSLVWRRGSPSRLQPDPPY